MNASVKNTHIKEPTSVQECIQTAIEEIEGFIKTNKIPFLVTINPALEALIKQIDEQILSIQRDAQRGKASSQQLSKLEQLENPLQTIFAILNESEHTYSATKHLFESAFLQYCISLNEAKRTLDLSIQTPTVNIAADELCQPPTIKAC